MYCDTTNDAHAPDGADGLPNAACNGVITSSKQLAGAEIGLTIDQGRNLRAHPLYPSYCLLVRILELSINDYQAAKTDAEREAEVLFWREGRLFLFYAHLVCEIELCLHGRELSPEDLRRGAESRMGLPRGCLTPDRPLSLKEEQGIACQVREQFAYIRREVGHVPDEQADKRFSPRRRPAAKKARASMSNTPAQLSLMAVG